MSKEIVVSSSAALFEYEILDSNAEILRENPWIDPERLKLKDRIGRGPFGDVWLATHHESTEDYEEYHEVAAKMLHPLRDDDVEMVLEKFKQLYFRCQGVASVSRLHGISIINGRVRFEICIIMKSYPGSIGDKMARLREGRIPLHDVLRWYGINLAKCVMELHSRGILILNLKPHNVLVNDKDEVILGEVGIPSLLSGTSFVSSDMAKRLGTPNYMAPEQWDPEVRGPISFETDSWGFGCTIVEMLTGSEPWCGCPLDSIFELAVENKEKPDVPIGLPPSVEKILSGCFEYDLRNRPLMVDIQNAFKSALNEVGYDEGWVYRGYVKVPEASGSTVCTEWFITKDHLKVGDMVRSRKAFNSAETSEKEEKIEGSVVGLGIPDERFPLVRMEGGKEPVRIPSSNVERVTQGFAAGDWVRLKDEKSRVGILHGISRDGRVAVGFLGLQTLWKGTYSELEKAEPFYVGQLVMPKAGVLNPRFAWPHESGGGFAAGRISWILPNGCLAIEFPGILPFLIHGTTLADPSQVQLAQRPRLHWAVKSLFFAFALFAAFQFGSSTGHHHQQQQQQRTKNQHHSTPTHLP
ncbi:hypothetical protein Fmac_031947 [Flemingia macrophylla]|uniref:Protein kinase domain-containing protein n=1 Tax=Flemingia macrophylla TaxID=520843 RepID=A0ABD1L3I7_9FABA